METRQDFYLSAYNLLLFHCNPSLLKSACKRDRTTQLLVVLCQELLTAACDHREGLALRGVARRMFLPKLRAHAARHWKCLNDKGTARDRAERSPSRLASF